MKALALFSGGLDSVLAIKVITEQGIEVIALNFVSYFFGGKNERADNMARQLGVKLEYIDFKEEQKKIVLDPPNGHGKNLNPCIDCHALMIRTAGKMMEEYGASFIITGEVYGERPMSQNPAALKRVAHISGMEGYIVRPLSAKLLAKTIPEEKGWIDREKLLNLSGRGRKRQIELAKQYNIVDYASPGGGCLLTEATFTDRLRRIRDDGRFEDNFLFDIVRNSRMFALGKGKYIFVGRDGHENTVLDKYKSICKELVIKGAGVPGPLILGTGGEFSQEEIEFAKAIFNRYGKQKGVGSVEVLVNDKIESAEVKDIAKLEENMKKYII